MGVLRTAVAVTGWVSFGSALGFTFWTRKSKVLPIPPTDYIFHSTLFARYNPNNNPVTQDVCVRRVALQRVRSELLENEGKLVESFCAGVWSGWGRYRILAKRQNLRADEEARQAMHTNEDI